MYCLVRECNHTLGQFELIRSDGYASRNLLSILIGES
jgi:hypothetical protein